MDIHFDERNVKRNLLHATHSSMKVCKDSQNCIIDTYSDSMQLALWLVCVCTINTLSASVCLCVYHLTMCLLLARLAHGPCWQIYYSCLFTWKGNEILQLSPQLDEEKSKEGALEAIKLFLLQIWCKNVHQSAWLVMCVQITIWLTLRRVERHTRTQYPFLCSCKSTNFYSTLTQQLQLLVIRGPERTLFTCLTRKRGKEWINFWLTHSLSPNASLKEAFFIFKSHFFHPILN